MNRCTVRLLFTLATASILAGCGLSPGPGEDPGALPAETLAPPAARYAAAAEQVRQHARDLIVDENLPGVSIAVAVDGAVAWAEALGWSDLEERVPLTATDALPHRWVCPSPSPRPPSACFSSGDSSTSTRPWGTTSRRCPTSMGGSRRAS